MRCTHWRSSTVLRRAVVPLFETLESRTLLSASIVNGDLQIDGSDDRDVIVLSQDGSTLSVSENGVVSTFASNQYVRIRIDARSGNDSVLIEDSVDRGVFVYGGSGDDILIGGIHNDTLGGGSGRDKLYGNAGDDRLNGHGGHDKLFGQTGKDRLYDGDGDDLSDGGAHNDKFYGGLGRDTFLGQGGNDTFYVNGENGVVDSVYGGSGTDRARVDSSDFLASIEQILTNAPPPNNLAPVINAGEDQTITLGPPAVLNGSASDDGLPGGTLGILWSKLSGPGDVLFSDATQIATNASFSSAGVYVLQLSVDDGSLVSTDTLTITVNPPITNNAPAVNAGSDQNVLSGSVIALNGNALDDGLPANGSLSLNWTKVSGPGAVNFGDTSQASTTAIITVTGTYVLRLTANDGELSSQDDVTITVTSPPTNTPPVVDAGASQSVQLPQSASLDPVISDDGLPNGTLTSTWSKLSGPGNVFFGNANSPQTSADFSEPGVYVLRLTVSDGGFLTIDDVTITVNPADPPSQTPFLGSPFAIPASGIAVIEAEDFDLGSAGDAYLDVEEINFGYAYRWEGVDILADPNVGNGHAVGWVRSGEFLEYTIDVAEAGDYQISLIVASPNPGGTYTYLIDGVSVTGNIDIPNTGDWNVYQSSNTVVSLSAGQQVLRLAIGGEQPYDVANLDSIQISRL